MGIHADLPQPGLPGGDDPEAPSPTTPGADILAGTAIREMIYFSSPMDLSATESERLLEMDVTQSSPALGDQQNTTHQDITIFNNGSY